MPNSYLTFLDAGDFWFNHIDFNKGTWVCKGIFKKGFHVYLSIIYLLIFSYIISQLQFPFPPLISPNTLFSSYAYSIVFAWHLTVPETINLTIEGDTHDLYQRDELHLNCSSKLNRTCAHDTLTLKWHQRFPPPLVLMVLSTPFECELIYPTCF